MKERGENKERQGSEREGGREVRRKRGERDARVERS
jgi:hypothetical protein